MANMTALQDVCAAELRLTLLVAQQEFCDQI